jgi:hypothetical protein
MAKILDVTASKNNMEGCWFGPNGEKVAILDEEDGVFRVVNVNTGSNIAVYDIEEEYDTLRFRGAKKFGSIVYIFDRNDAYKFDFLDNSLIQMSEFADVNDYFTSSIGYGSNEVIVFDENVTKVAIGGTDKIEITDVASETSDWSTTVNSTSRVEFLDMSPDASYVVCTDIDHQDRVYIYDVETGDSSEQVFYGHENISDGVYITFMKFIDNTTVLSGDANGTIIEWDITDLSIVDTYTVNSGVYGATDALQFDRATNDVTGETLTDSGDGLTFEFTNSPLQEGSVTVYDDVIEVSSGITIDHDTGTVTFDSSPTTPVTADYTWLGNEEKMMSGGDAVKIYDKANRTILRQTVVGGAVNKVEISDDETMIAIATDDGVVEIHSLGVYALVHRPTDLTNTSITLQGELYDLGSYSSVDVSFEYSTDSDFSTGVNSTTPETLSEPGEFSANVTSLNADTKYYVRAVVEPTA